MFQGFSQRIVIWSMIGLGAMFVVVGQFFDAPGSDDTLMLMIIMTVGMLILLVLMAMQAMKPRQEVPEPESLISDEMVGAMFLAREEAEQSGQATITDMHLLRGLLRTRGSTAEMALSRAGVSLESLPASIPQPPSTFASGEGHQVPLSITAQRCLRTANEEAQQLGHHQMRTEHVLLALLRADVSSVSGILLDAGLDRGGVLALMVVSGV